MKIDLNAIFSKKEHDTVLQSLLENPPMTIMVGTVATSVKKDVIAYARGIADSQIVAKESSYADAIKIGGHWVYEVHEGGSGKSLARWLISTLDFSDEFSISIPLAGARVAMVSSVDDEISTIIFPPDEDRHRKAVQKIKNDQHLIDYSPEQLSDYIDSGIGYLSAGKLILAISIFIFISSVALYSFSARKFTPSNFLFQLESSENPTRTAANNIPLFQLNLAVNSMKKDGGFLSYLKYENEKWTFKQQPSEKAGKSP